LTLIQGMANEIKSTKTKQVILKNSDYLLKMVNQILQLAKLESGTIPKQQIQADIITFLSYQTEAWSSFANTKYISLNFYSKLKSLEMDFDPEKLEQILTNLLSNALKFTPKYGKIQVVAEKKGDQFKIIIKDSGSGISEEALPYIFDKFYQKNARKSNVGTGIGLALVKQLVKILDGAIDVTSQPHIGTVFTISLPIKNDAVQQSLPINRQVHDAPMQVSKELKIKKNSFRQQDLSTLLLIEDNLDIINYLHSILENDYHLLSAENGKVGVKVAISNLPDLIICDVMMPEMDGFEVCQILKEDTLTCHIPIILLTAKATQIDKNEGLSYGADAYLTKPFNKEELHIRLENLISIRKKLHARFAQGLIPLKSEKTEIAPKDSAFLEKLSQYIKDHIEEENLEIIYLQKAVNMSRTQLHKKLKALTGMSTSQFRKTVRLQEAKKLLESGEDLTIAEIAYKVGYKHPSHFSRDFKDLFGRSPTEV